MSWASVAPILVSVATALGASEILKLAVTRGSRRVVDGKTSGETKKVNVEAEAVISSELRQWTTQAESRAARAEERAERAELRAEATEVRLQARIDELGTQLDSMERQVERMRVLIRDCTAGPPCPVRIAIDRPAI